LRCICVTCSVFRNHNPVLSSFMICISGFVARVTHVEQDLLTITEHTSSSPILVGSCFCVVFCKSLFVLFFFFHLVNILSLLRFTASDYPFGIFKPFLWKHVVCTKLDIYVLVTITMSISLKEDVNHRWYHPASSQVFRHWHGLLDISIIQIDNS
jgi:hypothetical protein